MHKYLRAIGFSKCKNRKDVHKILERVAANPSSTGILKDGEELYGYFGLNFGKNMGIKIVGSYEDSDRMEEEYYIPYVESSVISSKLPLSIERYTDRLAYGGIIDDPGMGISIIFTLNNGIDVMIRKEAEKKVHVEAVSLNALCTSGKILLPLHKTTTQKEKLKIASKHRNQLIEAAREGDEGAMENLAMEEMTIMNNISNRIAKEDIYSLVDTCFMPYGLESDQYAVIGEIQNIEKITNRLTGEECYQLTLECNTLMLTVMINSEDLLGEPAIGRRFKGEIWLQGTAIMREPQ